MLITLAGFALAFANGANDNFKGVATLFGTGTADYRRTLLWGTVTTALGSIAALLLAGGLLETFRGGGIVPAEIVARPAFAAAVAGAAAFSVLAATRLGMPISTTHPLIGGLLGAGLAAAGGAVAWGVLGSKLMLPLLTSPLIAFGGAAMLYRVFRSARLRLDVQPDSCVCTPEAQPKAALAKPEAMALVASAPFEVGTEQEIACAPGAGITAARALNAARFLSAGSVGFARGLNDTPKIAAPLLIAPAFEAPTALVAVGAGMAVGAWIAARRVAETLAHRITAMNPGQGFTANMVTALLVVVASRFGLPVSTTHVSCGSLIGIGAAGHGAHWDTIRKVLLAWLVTMPCAAAVAWTCYRIAS